MINDIINMSKMFYECYHLISISEYPKKKNNQNIIDSNDNFSEYNLDSTSNEEKYSNIANINDSIIKDNNLLSLSNSSIQNNNTVSSEYKNSLIRNDMITISAKLIKIINLNEMFFLCISLEFLPDLSIWNISKVREMSHIFFYCNNLKS